MSAVILNKNIFWNSDFLSPISVSFTFFPLYFILLALSWFMCILFVLLLMNKSWHLAVLSFSRPPSFLPLHLEYFSSTTCPPPLLYHLFLALWPSLTLSALQCFLDFGQVLLWDQDTQFPSVMQPPKAGEISTSSTCKTNGWEDSDTGAKGYISLFFSPPVILTVRLK